MVGLGAGTDAASTGGWVNHCCTRPTQPVHYDCTHALTLESCFLFHVDQLVPVVGSTSPLSHALQAAMSRLTCVRGGRGQSVCPQAPGCFSTWACSPAGILAADTAAADILQHCMACMHVNVVTLVVENESGLNQKGANTREAPTSQVPQVRAPMLQSEQLLTNSCTGQGADS